MLILIKHARPSVDPTTAPELWPLAPEGRAAAEKLAERLRDFSITKIFHSDETKAIETAQILAATLAAPSELRENLHEHDRGNVPHMRSGEFISHMELFFRRPAERVFGRESADECEARFTAALETIISESGNAPTAVVTHGTVLALYLARQGTGKPFEIWRRMGLPSYAIVNSEPHDGVTIVDKVIWSDQ